MTTRSPSPAVRQLDADRLRRYAENLAFYAGDQWPASVTRQKNRRLVFNYAKAIVDKTTSYLMSGLNFAVDPAGGTPDDAARARAAEIHWRTSTTRTSSTSSTSIRRSMRRSGDGAYKVTWDAAERRVRVTAPDVQGLFAWWAGDDVSRVWRVASRYTIDAESARAMYGVQPKNAAGSAARNRLE